MKNHQSTKAPHHQMHRLQMHRAGFTLIEAALTTVIIGTGVLAIVAAQQAYHQKNDWAQRTGNAMRLANELRELTLPMPAHDPITGNGLSGTLGPEPDEMQPEAEADFDQPVVRLAKDQRLDYDDLDDFAGLITNGQGSGITFNPPINALREPIPDMDKWSQTVKVDNVPVDDIATEVFTLFKSKDKDTAMRLTVTIQYQKNGQEPQTVTSLRWLVMK